MAWFGEAFGDDCDDVRLIFFFPQSVNHGICLSYFLVPSSIMALPSILNGYSPQVPLRVAEISFCMPGSHGSQGDFGAAG